MAKSERGCQMTPRTRWIRILMGSVASLLLLNATPAQSQPLEFDEVLELRHRTRSAHSACRRRGPPCQGVTTEARGAFDPRIDGDLSLTGGAYYDLRSANAELRQPTSLWGSEIYVGYRVGVSIDQRWPTYRSDNQTLSGGELRAGIELPIWRGGVIDEPRAKRARAIHLEEAAEEDLSSAALNLELAAAGAYWSWVSAGQKLEVTKALLALAEDRDTQLRRRLAAGSIAEFDVTDNERILLERRAFLVSAQRSFEQAAFGLSLFLRDPAGRSVVPDPSRLPKEAVRSPEPELAEDLVQSRVLCLSSRAWERAGQARCGRDRREAHAKSARPRASGTVPVLARSRRAHGHRPRFHPPRKRVPGRSRALDASSLSRRTRPCERRSRQGRRQSGGYRPARGSADRQSA